MIPILIEPTCLSFDLVKQHFNISDDKGEIIAFKSFLQSLNILFTELRLNGLSIAVTKELSDLYKAGVPAMVYSGKHPVYNLARELYLQKLSKLVAVVHSFGDHPQTIEFDESNIDIDLNLHVTDTYLHWRDMSGLVFYQKLLPVVLKSLQVSIFKNNPVIMLDENKSFLFQIDVFNQIAEIIRTEHLSMHRISEQIGLFTLNVPSNVPCRGTGTHSSMWGHSITNIKDVPRDERTLLESLINTGVVRSITFLSFEKRYPPSAEPLIEIDEIEELDNSDILICTLRGQGRKQNAQTIKVEIEKGAGRILGSAFKNEISIRKLATLNQMIASSKELRT